MQGASQDLDAVRLGQRFSEDSARLLGARPSLEDGSSSFAALFGPSAGAGGGHLHRRDSQGSFVSSRPDDLLSLDLPGLQVCSSQPSQMITAVTWHRQLLCPWWTPQQRALE